jgi:hypothetical protein
MNTTYHHIRYYNRLLDVSYRYGRSGTALMGVHRVTFHGSVDLSGHLNRENGSRNTGLITEPVHNECVVGL